MELGKHFHFIDIMSAVAHLDNMNRNDLMKKINFKQEGIKEVISFCLIGLANTIICSMGMLFLYNLFGFGYWGSSVVVYILGSIWSFYMNRKCTFKSQGNILFAIVKFIINVCICYFMAYFVAEKIIDKVFTMLDVVGQQAMSDQIAMLMGMVIFTGLNFFGQKYFVFHKI